MKTDESPGAKLKRLRMVCRLSQEQLGNALGITKSSINAYEQDRNPINDNVKSKIERATGIGADYFDTDMDLFEACAKYKLDPMHLKLKSLTACAVLFYDSIDNFVAKKKPIDQKVMKVEILELLAEYSDSECCFVKVGKREGCSIAQEGDILVVVVDDDPLLGDWIILKHGRNRHILQYLKKSLTEDVVWLRSSIYSFELDYQTFRRYVEIVGIIKSKISISTKIQETIPDYLRK
ncbi:helix-turn-helix transcriptional regulator [uncultured Campylobacter sp.]|uniref:helix-turn-helix domain-containing protein n=1 Tax=uncultured Campylobacter sp. TaxID=218934 RepID=UPI002637AF7E|nr:helix-turn-helix transcriptional regulator [uncultured Campylobacter sp.]